MSGTWDKGDRPRYAEEASGWAEWTSLDSHACWRRAAAKKGCGFHSAFILHLLLCLGAWNSADTE